MTSQPPESARLKWQMVQAATRNVAATYAHIDAQHVSEFPFPVPLVPEDVTDRYARCSIEGAICWRDPFVSSPQIRARALAVRR